MLSSSASTPCPGNGGRQPIIFFRLPPFCSAHRWQSASKSPLLCLAGEIVCLVAVMLLYHQIPDMITILGISFGAALQSASFRQVERWKYLTVTVTGNMLRALDQSVASDRDAARGAAVMLLVCLMFLSGAAIGACVTKWLQAWSLVLPIASSVCVLWLCRPQLRS
ncbi:uncharacterized membrane protein YoaK (UPF0700 family) [Bradyrhizobium sp. LA6.1]